MARKIPPVPFFDPITQDISPVWRYMLETFAIGSHGDLSDILAANEGSVDTAKDKHVSNYQLYSILDHFRVVEIDNTDSPYTADTSQVIIVDASAGPVTVNLPALTAADERRYFVKKVDSSANAVTVAGAIDGQSTVDIIFQYDCMALVPTSTEWSIV